MLSLDFDSAPLSDYLGGFADDKLHLLSIYHNFPNLDIGLRSIPIHFSQT